MKTITLGLSLKQYLMQFRGRRKGGAIAQQMKKESNREITHDILLAIRFLEKYSVPNVAETSGELLLIPEKLFGDARAVLREARSAMPKQSNKVTSTQLSRKDSEWNITKKKYFGRLKAI